MEVMVRLFAAVERRKK